MAINVRGPEDHLKERAHFFEPQGHVISLGGKPIDPTKFLSKDEPWIIRYDHQSNGRDSRKFFEISNYEPILQAAAMNKKGKGMAFYTVTESRGFFSLSFHEVLQKVEFKDGKAVSSPVNICDMEEEGYSHFHAAMNSKEQAAVIWEKKEGKEQILEAVVNTEGKWSEPARLAVHDKALNPGGPRVAIDEEGNILAIWAALQSNRTLVVFTAYKPKGQPWGVPVPLSDVSKFSSKFEISSDVLGKFVVVWDELQQIEDKTHATVQGAAFSTASQTWTGALLSPPEVPAWMPSFAVNEKGQGIVVWIWTTFMDKKSWVQAAELIVD
jgi:hypothetical protein